MEYLFTSERLGFRAWKPQDLLPMTALNMDEKVMEFFPSTVGEAHTQGFLNRMKIQLKEFGYCYFAVDRLDSQTFIGFIGMSNQAYEAYFTPCVDIGWRLAQKHWGKGFATEGAKACLKYAFETLKLKKIYSVATKRNVNSIKVMQKIGMQYDGEFAHPKMLDLPTLKDCSVYRIDAPMTND